MKRIALLAAAMAACLTASIASAHVGAGPATRKLTATTNEWKTSYDASSYYGSVQCTGKTIVSKKYPGGRDVETCETTEGTLKRMKAGKEQHAFQSEGGEVGEWESDSGDGLRTTDYSYSVNKKLTKFRLVAVYAPPAES